MNRKGFKKKRDKKREIQRTEPSEATPEESKIPLNMPSDKRFNEEVLYGINKLFKQETTPEEKSEEEEEKETPPPTESQLISEDSEDVTKVFRNLSGELKVNEMIRSPNFILDDTMQSYELFNKKTDFRMDIPLDFNIQKLFDDGVLKPATELSLDETILMLDQLFLNECLFYRGYEAGQTINICALHYNPQRCYADSSIFSAIFECQNYLQFGLIEIIRNSLCQRDDDFQGPIIHERFTKLGIKEIKELFVKAEHEITAQEKKLKKEEETKSEAKKCEQIKIRLKFHRGWLEYIERLIAPRQLRDNMSTAQFKRNVEERFNFIKKQCLLLAQHCKETRDNSRLDFIKLYFKRDRIINFPGSIQPKHIPDIPSAQSYSLFLTTILETLQQATQIPFLFQNLAERPHLLSYPELIYRIQKINRESNYNLLVRVVTQNILFPLSLDTSQKDFDLKMSKKALKAQKRQFSLVNEIACSKLFGKENFGLTDLFIDTLHQLFPKVVQPKAKKGTKPVYIQETEIGRSFLERYALIVKKHLARFMKSKTRQHRNAVDIFKEILIMLNEANYVDVFFQEAMKNDPFLSNLYPATNMTLHLEIDRMVEQIHAMFNLDILQFSEYKRAFYYMSYIYTHGINNHRITLYNVLHSAKTSEAMPLVEAIVANEMVLEGLSPFTRYLVHEWAYFFAMQSAYRGVAILMDKVGQLAQAGQIVNVRYPDPWELSYSGVDKGEEEKKEGSLVVKLKKAAYNERFKAFRIIPLPKYLSFETQEEWFEKTREEGLIAAKNSLMEAGQVFTAMKKFKGRLDTHFSDAILDSLSRRCVSNSFLVLKLEKLKVGLLQGQEEEKAKVVVETENEKIPRLDIEKI